MCIISIIKIGFHSSPIYKRTITSSEDAFVAHKTRHPGNGSIAIRDDGKICAIGGWDGRYATAISVPLDLTY